MGAAAAALVCAALLGAGGDLNLGVGASSETRAGQSPGQANADTRQFVATVLIPSVELVLRTGDFDLRLGYGARLFWQDSTTDASAPARPLLLHLATASTTFRPSARAAITAHASGSAGEADYSYLTQVLGPNQSALPLAVNILSVTGDVGLRVQATRRLRVTVGARGEHRQSLGDTPAPATPADPSSAPAPPFPNQTLAGTDSSVEYKLARRQDLIVATPVLYGDYGNSVQVVTAAAKAGWRLWITPHDRLDVALGVAGGHDLGTIHAVSLPLSPVGSVSVDSAGLRPGNVPLHLAGALSVEYGVDPILLTAGPRGQVTAQFMAAPATDWIVGVEATLATTLRTQPLNSADPDETTVSVSLPIRHRVSSYFLAELGARGSERGPTFASPNFGLHQRQLWVYLLLTGASLPTAPWTTP